MLPTVDPKEPEDIFFKFIYLFKTAQVEEGKREKERESQAGSVLPAQSLTWGLKS